MKKYECDCGQIYYEYAQLQACQNRHHAGSAQLELGSAQLQAAEARVEARIEQMESDLREWLGADE